MPKKASQMNRRIAETAVLPGKITTENSPREKCIPLFALRTANEPKSLLNQTADKPVYCRDCFSRRNR